MTPQAGRRITQAILEHDASSARQQVESWAPNVITRTRSSSLPAPWGACVLRRRTEPAPGRCRRRLTHLRMRPVELAVHPADDDGRHELYLICDDIPATFAESRAKGGEVACDVSD